ncbi:uncharacterized protein LOC109717194 [Ananas comosus]|uniref:Uncharacterized protein LOC109717194 n=1 Tax=Ananas comosus TaxID=4615 RepID=A0A6P5FZN7_ANACO|nr:uncharacterized protein LOC109717194 [Ananas comosus]
MVPLFESYKKIHGTSCLPFSPPPNWACHGAHPQNAKPVRRLRLPSPDACEGHGRGLLAPPPPATGGADQPRRQRPQSPSSRRRRRRTCRGSGGDARRARVLHRPRRPAPSDVTSPDSVGFKQPTPGMMLNQLHLCFVAAQFVRTQIIELGLVNWFG